MKLFQIEEPDGSPIDSDAPGVAIGVDLGGSAAEVAVAVGGNAVVLADRDGFALDLAVPPPDASPDAWRHLFEGVRVRAERALAQPVTHAVVTLASVPEPDFAAVLLQAADATGLTLLHITTHPAPSRAQPADAQPADAAPAGTEPTGTEFAGTEPPALAAAILAEELAPPRPAP